MRILIVEDEKQLCQLIHKRLTQRGFASDMAFCGSEGWEKADVTRYDVMLLDLNLPDMDGIELLRTLRLEGNAVPIIIVSARNEVEQRSLALNLGADDFVVKPFDFSELEARIQAVIRRVCGYSRPQISIGTIAVLPSERKVFFDGREVILSAKEYGIFEYLAMKYPNVVSAEELIEHVYGESLNPFSSVLRVHLTNIRRRFSALTDEPVIETLKGQGYRLSGKLAQSS